VGYHDWVPRIVELRAEPGYVLWIRYDDGVKGEVDLSGLRGRGVFAAWTDQEAFAEVSLEPHGAVAWTDRIELCPDALYLRLTGKSAEDFLPPLRRAPADA
jgi:hypothetical protein